MLRVWSFVSKKKITPRLMSDSVECRSVDNRSDSNNDIMASSYGQFWNLVVLSKIGPLQWRSRWKQGARGTFAPSPDFGRIRSKSYSVKRPFITDCPPRFSDLPPALNDDSWNVTVRRLSVSLCVLYCVFTLQARPDKRRQIQNGAGMTIISDKSD